MHSREGSLEERVVVVNRAFVDTYWPEGQQPVGQRVRHNSDPPEWTAQVVGVVESVRQWGASYRPLPEMYFPYSVHPRTESTLVAKAAGDPLSVVAAIRAKVLHVT